MSESESYTDYKQFYCGVDYKNGAADKADADRSSCSDIDDFERLSIPDSDPMSGDETIMDAACRSHMPNSVDTNSSSKTAQIVPFSFAVQKPPDPPTIPTVTTPSMLTEACRRAHSPGGMERSTVSSDLFALARDVDQLLVRELCIIIV